MNIDYSKPITPADFLKAELDMGISFENESFVQLANETVNQVKDLAIKSVFDFGAGTGVYAESFRKAGYDTYAFELWDEHKKYIRENAPLIKIVSQPVTTDLMCFIEVAEHMTDDELKYLFSKISPTYILFSSTSKKTEWDYAWGHINIKPQPAWVEFFQTKGYKLIRNLSYPTQYTKLFEQ